MHLAFYYYNPFSHQRDLQYTLPVIFRNSYRTNIATIQKKNCQNVLKLFFYIRLSCQPSLKLMPSMEDYK